MKKVNNIGNMPDFLKSFLTGIQLNEAKGTEVFDCHYDEIIAKANYEKLEAQVMIDRKTDRAYLCCIGASVRTDLMAGESLNPVFYFSELDEPRKKQFQYELRKARAKVIKDHEDRIEADKRLKKAARDAAEGYRDGKTGTDI